ncbi:MAG: 1-deoxy-D-xylulose-5-phosphate synthase [Parachlamydiales bacterium]|nr:1-deoxy-D-xylulose-5-phosphate synthase [Parachlamydiales bacterium]
MLHTNLLKDFKTISFEELDILAEDIRKKIIEVLSKNGGHLASNLGIVELTIALHRVFNSPIDKLIFDVSHQSYTHKILTNRLDKFDTIRQYKGLCGFSNPDESDHDHFHLGHAGTALSLALGLTKNRDFLKTDDHIIPIIGDASLTCGLTLEALNNISENTKNLVVILNDNNMAISKNVGNIKNILSRLLNNPKTLKFYSEIEMMLSKIPAYGKLLAKQGKKVAESIKNLVSPAPFFEHLNLSYIGPIDGHNIKKLVQTLERVKNLNHPVLIHVMTTKGKGMPKAIENPTSYHGVKPFDKVTGEFLDKSEKNTFPKVFGKHMIEMAKNDETITIVNPAMLQGSSLNEFKIKFPDRCFDVGIAEGHSITFAGGLAYKKNLNVMVSIYSTFLQRAFDNLFHDICLQNLNVVFAIDRAGLSGPDGSTHHGIYDISFLNAMPNMVIANPRNANLLKELLNIGFLFDSPVAIRYPNLETEEIDIPIRKLDQNSYDIISKGEKVLIISIGHMYKTAIAVKENLLRHDINPTILDPIFIKPLNEKLLLKLLKTHDTVFTLEEHSKETGFGSIFNNFLISNNLSHIKTFNFGIPNGFAAHGKNSDLLKEMKLDDKSVTDKILNVLNINLKSYVQGNFL